MVDDEVEVEQQVQALAVWPGAAQVSKHTV